VNEPTTEVFPWEVDPERVRETAQSLLPFMMSNPQLFCEPEKETGIIGSKPKQKEYPLDETLQKSFQIAAGFEMHALNFERQIEKLRADAESQPPVPQRKFIIEEVPTSKR